MIMSVSGAAIAQLPVFFADTALEAAVEDQLGVMDPTPIDMLNLIYLDASVHDIYYLAGLEYAINLRQLDLTSNWIFDVSPISRLANLEWLYLDDNAVDDISSFSGLPSLEVLSMSYNQVSDISVLASLPRLKYLGLYNNAVDSILPLAPLVNLIELDLGANQIRDISAIAPFTHLELLLLDSNPLNTPAYCTHLPLIAVNNPLIPDFDYDPNPNPFTRDCSTNIAELAQWVSPWLDTGCHQSNNWCAHRDLDHDGNLNAGDFGVFAHLWQAGPQ